MHFMLNDMHYALLATLLLALYFIRRVCRPGYHLGSIINGLVVVSVAIVFTVYCAKSNILYALDYKIDVFYISMITIAIALYMHLMLSFEKK